MEEILRVVDSHSVLDHHQHTAHQWRASLHKTQLVTLKVKV